MLVGLVSPFTTVSANEGSANGITIIEKGKDNLEYIQKKKEGTFKVIEKTTPDTGNVESKIYKLSENGEYELYEKQTVTITENKDAIVEIIFVNGEKEEIVIEIQQPTGTKEMYPQGEDFSTVSDTLTPWIYSGTSEFYTQSLIGLTISAIQTILDNTIGLPGWGNALFDVAVWAVNNNHDALYISVQTSYDPYLYNDLFLINYNCTQVHNQQLPHNRQGPK